jgi:hypothetical protein
MRIVQKAGQQARFAAVDARGPFDPSVRELVLDRVEQVTIDDGSVLARAAATRS